MISSSESIVPWSPKIPMQGDEHDHPREDREDRVVGERGRVVGELQTPIGAGDALSASSGLRRVTDGLGASMLP